MSIAQGFGGNVIGLTNAAAATVYYAVIPGTVYGGVNQWTRLVQFQWVSGNTANSFTLMRPMGRTTALAAAAANVATITLAGDPSNSGNVIAAGDQVVVLCTDGTYRRSQVNTAGWNSTTNVVTFTANNPAAVALGAAVFWFGVPADTEPLTGSAFPVVATVANTTNTTQFSAAGFTGFVKGDPLMIYNPNATNATNINFAEYVGTTT